MAILAELYKIIVVIDSTYKSNKNPAMSNYFSFIECQHDSKTIANTNCPFPDIHGASFPDKSTMCTSNKKEIKTDMSLAYLEILLYMYEEILKVGLYQYLDVWKFQLEMYNSYP